jgi:hypothetical protein
MVAAAVLAAGILVVFPAFFVSVDAAQIAEDRLYIQMWAQNKIWEEQEAYARLKTVEAAHEVGDFKIGERVIRWEKIVEGAGESLQEVSLVFSWVLGGRPRHVMYSAYLVL